MEDTYFPPTLEFLTGAAEQVKQLLHRNSELLLQTNFKHLGYMKGKFFVLPFRFLNFPNINGGVPYTF